MKKVQSGFTMIELVIVIVVLGILAAFAIPKYIDLKADAEQGAVDGVAGALSSAMAVNYAARKANALNGVAVANCSTGATMLQGGALPTGHAITAGAVAVDASASCTLTYATKTATFTAIGI